MPIYEYVCEADGEVIELLRSMNEATGLRLSLSLPCNLAGSVVQ